MKLYSKAILCMALAAALLCSCQGVADLDKRVEQMENLVEALSVQVNKLNDKVNTLSALIEVGAVREFSENGGVYTLTLCNGEVITLEQGSMAPVPLITVDEDGFWMADYGDGQGAVYIKNNAGEMVNSKGQNAATPVFSVDAEGYWCVSYTGSQTIERIKDASGNPVKATTDASASPNALFKEVTYSPETQMLHVVLGNDTALDIPVLSGFLCRIENAGKAVYRFSDGQSRSWDVSIEGASNVLVYAPEGWKASLEGGVLTVTAPELVKSLAADSSKDVSILAISSSGYSAVAKVQVELIPLSEQIQIMTLEMTYEARYGLAGGLSVYVTDQFSGISGADGEADRTLVKAMYDGGMQGWTKLGYEEGASKVVTSQTYDVKAYSGNFCMAFHWNPVYDGKNAQRTYCIDGRINVLYGDGSTKNFNLKELGLKTLMMNTIFEPYRVNESADPSIKLNDAVYPIFFKGCSKDTMKEAIDGWVFVNPTDFTSK